MALDAHFLASKVARRLFLLFVLCALVPIAALALFSFGRVSGQLHAQAEQRLESNVRAVGQGIAERLLLLRAELSILIEQVDEGNGAVPETRASAAEFEPDHFVALGFVDASGNALTIFGELGEPPALSERQLAHLERGGTLVHAEPRPGAPPRVLLVQVTPTEPDRLAFASVYPPYLWGGGEGTLPDDTELCIFSASSEVLFCTVPPDGVLPETIFAAMAANAHAGGIEWTLDGDDYIASYWSMNLDFVFGVPQWTVMLSEQRDVVLAPMAGFRRAFPPIVLVSLLVVLLVSVYQIRRNLDPLEQLQEGTRRIAARDFDSRVEVESGDEFEELAVSFNDMAGRLGKQFTALATIAEIDRTILSALDIRKIVTTVLRRTSELVRCKAVSVTLVAADQQKVPRTYTLRSGRRADPWVETTFFSPDDLRMFTRNPEWFAIRSGDGAPAYVAPLARGGCAHLLVFPMFVKEQPSGVIAIGFAAAPAVDDEDLKQVRRLTDQVAVALANTYLLEDLDALNWGALTALARTVDAKSPWTAGHSERVTSLAIKIARAVGLGDEAVETIHRGGLLHDIGKIGVPAAILDKPAQLTDDEYEIMKKHPGIGAKILQPIAAYAAVIPIVHQHHERWDGGGYPEGRAGSQIHRFARIVAVADVFDALTSKRPYRDAMPVEEATRTIIAESQRAFDPDVVTAFVAVMRGEGHEVGDDRLLASG